MDPLKRAEADLKAAHEQRVKLLEAIEGRTPTESEDADIKALSEKIKTLTVTIDGLKAIANAKDESTGYLRGVKGGDAPTGVTGAVIPAAGEKSIGQMFVESEAFKSAVKNNMSRVEKQEFVKTLITNASTSGGSFIVPQQSNIVDPGTFVRPLNAIGLVTRLVTSSNAIEFVRQTAFTNNAAPTPDADSTDSADNTGRKPESAMTWERVSTSVKWIPHGIPILRSTMDDAPQLQSMIDQMLVYGLLEELEDQIISGDGLGDNFTGILSTANVQTQAFSSSKIETLRKALTKVKITGRAQPTAILLNPNDWESIELTLDAEDRYLLGGPVAPAQPRLWGLSVVESEAIAPGTALVGDFKKAIIWDRMAASVDVFDQHKDFAEKNMLYLRAEMRAAFGVIRPKAFCKATLA